MRIGLLAVSVVTLTIPTAFPAPALAPPGGKAKKFRRPVRVLEGITFDVRRGELYLPVRDLRQVVGLPVREAGSRVLVGRRALPRRATWRLLDGTRLVSVRGLKAAGVPVGWDRLRRLPVVAHRGKDFPVRAGLKRLVVNRAEQRMRGWQGSRLVLETIVSTGAPGFTTPRGQFTAGPFKAVMHHSSIYNNAPMPFTVQVIGNICIHGSGSVPRYPASHGCVRVPLTGANPARAVYEWVNRGAAVMIRDGWVVRT